MKNKRRRRVSVPLHRVVGAWTPAWNHWIAEHGQPIDEIEMAHWHNAWGDSINRWVLMFMRRAFDAGRRSANAPALPPQRSGGRQEQVVGRTNGGEQ